MFAAAVKFPWTFCYTQAGASGAGVPRVECHISSLAYAETGYALHEMFTSLCQHRLGVARVQKQRKKKKKTARNE